MIQIGQSNATIAEPIEHLMACHRRIEQRLEVLCRAADHFHDQRQDALRAIDSSIRFLDTSGALHTQDEEESLFPRLRPLLSDEEIAYVDSLEEQHDEVESVFAALKELVSKIQAAPEADNEDAVEAEYVAIAAKMAALYRGHIRSEDEILASISRRLLNPEQLKEISGEMRTRRTNHN